MHITHKFINEKIDLNIEILIVGTFNPNVLGNDADFFYSRKNGRSNEINYLWKLLPLAFDESDLRGKSKTEKEKFMKDHKIGFTDLIEEINVEEGQENNYSDNYLNKREIKWKDLISLIKNHNLIKEIYFTRKTFSGINKIESKVNEIKKYCEDHQIKFQLLITPSRFCDNNKIKSWKESFND